MEQAELVPFTFRSMTNPEPNDDILPNAACAQPEEIRVDDLQTSAGRSRTLVSPTQSRPLGHLLANGQGVGPETHRIDSPLPPALPAFNGAYAPLRGIGRASEIRTTLPPMNQCLPVLRPRESLARDQLPVLGSALTEHLLATTSWRS